MKIFATIAFVSGAAIATQASMNAQLGKLLESPLLAACIAFGSSIFFTSIALVAVSRDFPTIETLQLVPKYLWLSGGFLAAFAISMFYYLIPKMGIGPMMSFALSGQLIVAVTLGHFGWFDLPVKPINISTSIGVAALVTGIVLINHE